LLLLLLLLFLLLFLLFLLLRLGLTALLRVTLVHAAIARLRAAVATVAIARRLALDICIATAVAHTPWLRDCSAAVRGSLLAGEADLQQSVNRGLRVWADATVPVLLTLPRGHERGRNALGVEQVLNCEDTTAVSSERHLLFYTGVCVVDKHDWASALVTLDRDGNSPEFEHLLIGAGHTC